MENLDLQLPQPAPHSKHLKVYPLSGVLLCDNCGRPYHGTSSSSSRNIYARMWHSAHRCDIPTLSISAIAVEKQFVERVLACIKLDNNWKGPILKALSTNEPKVDVSAEIARIESAMANLRKQHLWGMLSDEQLKSEYNTLESQRNQLKKHNEPVILADIERSAELLADLTSLWQHPGTTPEQRRSLARQAFEEVRIKDNLLVAVGPRERCIPLFAYQAWKENVVGSKQST